MKKTIAERTPYDCELRLPHALRKWREARGIATAKAAYEELERLTGIPRRTFEHVDAGRGFRYPKLLLFVLESV